MKYDAIIFDGMNTAHKAYHVNKYLSVQIDGETFHTGMMYGFLSMMSKIYSMFGKRNTRVYIVWDSIDSADGNKKVNSHYKENRKPKTEQELLDKINFDKLVSSTMGLLSTLNIMQFRKSKVEADDIGATLATKLANRNKSVLIVTEDKDYRQLISDRIHLYGITQRLVWDLGVFQQKTGLFKPSHFVDYLAICGDAIDDFSGVFGFGDTKAIQLLTDDHFVDLEYISQYLIDNPDDIDLVESWTPKTKKSFKNGLSDLAECFLLAKLDTDIKSVEVIVKKHYVDLSMFELMTQTYQMRSIKKDMPIFRRIFEATQYWNKH